MEGGGERLECVESWGKGGLTVVGSVTSPGCSDHLTEHRMLGEVHLVARSRTNVALGGVLQLI